MASRLDIDPNAFLADLHRLREFGRDGAGVHRVAYSDADRDARAWLRGRMEDAGLRVRVDGVGNVIGRTSGVGPALAIGSHTDTVPHGGWLDGAYGVIAGLEVARAAQRLARPPAIEVISFADEEGAFFGTLGSSVLCGIIEPETLTDSVDEQGRRWRDLLEYCGYAPEPIIRFDPAGYLGYLELHIEQGPMLERRQVQIGAVTGIVGMRRYQVSFSGRADHAGSTPMLDRLDAGAAALRCATDLLDQFERRRRADTVWNIGSMRFDPGAGNVVPGKADFLVEFRDTDPVTLDVLDAMVIESVEAHSRSTGCPSEISTIVHAPPVVMDEAMVRLVEDAATDRGLSRCRMPSAAGHDAMNVARIMPTAMVFVPSIAGRSHHSLENTAENDLVNGLWVLAAAVGLIGGAT